MGGFLLFFIAFFTVHAIFKVQHIPPLTYQSSVADAACEHAQRPACCPNFQCPWLAGCYHQQRDTKLGFQFLMGAAFTLETQKGAQG